MNNLIINPTNNPEYFKNNLEVIFLNDVRDVNIIIGANNTRKSRLVRSILAQKTNLILGCDVDLNKAFLASKSLFEPIIAAIGKELSEPLVQLQVHDTNQESRPYINIKEFARTNNKIDFFSIRTAIENINETMLRIDSVVHFESLTKSIQRIFDVVTMLESVYKFLSDHQYKSLNDGSFHGTTVTHIQFLTPSQMHNHLLLHGELKLQTLRDIKTYLEILLTLKYIPCDKSLVYIPVLRTSRTLGKAGEDLFEEAIVKHHFPEHNEKMQIHTGLKLYEKIGLARNGTRKESREFHEFEKFIGQVFFHSPDLHIVAHQSKKSEEQHIKVSLPGEMEDVSIQNLGDGVQGVINLLFPVFTAEDGSWIFIDEPENHLHPGYQNVFMNAIMENETIKKKELRFFINTHSNHIMSGALLGKSHAEVFVFSRRDATSSDITSFNGNEVGTLEALGVLNTSVLTSNCTVWVEGITDRLYLQAFLHAYGEKQGIKFRPVEGLHYSFVEYGGKNLVHYDFDHEIFSGEKNGIAAYFINSNIFLLMDSDFKPEKHERYEKIKRNNFKFCKTGVPEVENVLPDELLKSYLIVGLNCDEKEVDACFAVPWHNQKLGAYLQNKISYGKKFRSFEDKGGTLSAHYKKGLANFVHARIIDGTFKWDDLKKSKPLAGITEALYHFIEQKNPIN